MPSEFNAYIAYISIFNLLFDTIAFGGDMVSEAMPELTSASRLESILRHTHHQSEGCPLGRYISGQRICGEAVLAKYRDSRRLRWFGSAPCKSNIGKANIDFKFRASYHRSAV